MKTKEQLIKEIMREAAQDGEPVTEAEAAEMAEMEIKAAENGRRYEGDATKRKKPNRTVKIDEEKVAIIKSVSQHLTKFIGKKGEIAKKITVVNKQREITFSVGENQYSLTLTKHRPGK